MEGRCAITQKLSEDEQINLWIIAQAKKKGLGIVFIPLADILLPDSEGRYGV